MFQLSEAASDAASSLADMTRKMGEDIISTMQGGIGGSRCSDAADRQEIEKVRLALAAAESKDEERWHGVLVQVTDEDVDDVTFVVTLQGAGENSKDSPWWSGLSLSIF